MDIKKHFVGRDGFVWWVGQVVDETTWASNAPCSRTGTTDDQSGFSYRYKVRIMGYHTASPSDLKDDDLPWASVMMPVTAGSGGAAASATPMLRQGNFVYGFFLDGEEAQTPIIMGIIGNNQYLAVSKEITEVPFLPFSGFVSKGDGANPDTAVESNPPRYGLPTQTDGKVPPDSQLALAEKYPGTSEDMSNGVSVESDVSLSSGIKDGASGEKHLDERRAISLPSPSTCEKVPLNKIQAEIQETVKIVSRIKKASTDWNTKVTTRVFNPDKEIEKAMDDAAKLVASAMKFMVTEIQKNALKKLNDTSKNSYYSAFPTERQDLKKAMDKVNDSTACLFRNIIDKLYDMSSGMLKSSIPKMINSPACATEDLASTILGEITGLISAGMNDFMKPLSALGSISGDGFKVPSFGGDDVLGTVTELLSFLDCDENPECNEVKEWNVAEGPLAPPRISLGSIVSKAKSKASLIATALEAAGQVIDPNNFSFGGINFGLPGGGADSGCDVGPINCGPPIVEFFGGKGEGAAANAIIGTGLSVLGVDIKSSGLYTVAPKIKFVDKCGKGNGASGRVVLGPVQPILNDNGTPLFDDEGNPLYEAAPGVNVNTVINDTFADGGTRGTVNTILNSNTTVNNSTGAPLTTTLTSGGTGTDGGDAAGTVTFRGDITSGSADITNVTNITKISTGMTIKMTTDGETVTIGGSDIDGRGGDGNWFTVGTRSNSAVVTSVDLTTSTVTIDQVFGGSGSALGVTFTATVDSTGGGLLGVVGVIMNDTGYGYIPTGDGSKGAAGWTWAESNETTVKRADGTFETPLQPGAQIELFEGDTVSFPGGIDHKLSSSESPLIITAPILPTEETGPVDIPKLGITIGPPTDRDKYAGLGDGKYPVILGIESVNVSDPGFNYSPTDEITVSPNNGAKLIPKFDPLGSLIGVDILNSGSGFNDDVDIYIKSKTGYNAKMIPVFNVKSVGDDPNLLPDDTSLVQVIDCVGKF
tara:strand:+ start:25 stop:2985 length:2961 start_codon:yes stop_codon:yes gene_type:complete